VAERDSFGLYRNSQNKPTFIISSSPFRISDWPNFPQPSYIIKKYLHHSYFDVHLTQSVTTWIEALCSAETSLRNATRQCAALTTNHHHLKIILRIRL